MIELALAKLFTLYDLRSPLNTLKTLQMCALTTFRFMVHKFNRIKLEYLIQMLNSLSINL